MPTTLNFLRLLLLGLLLNLPLSAAVYAAEAEAVIEPELAEEETYPLSIELSSEEEVWLEEEGAGEEDAYPLTIELSGEGEMPAEEVEWLEPGEVSAEDGDAYPLSIALTAEDALIEANTTDAERFSDRPMLRNLHYPAWFKSSFLDLPEDIESATTSNKIGIMLYFWQKHCAYCETMNEVIFAREDLKAYINNYFDAIAIDVWGTLPVVTPDQQEMTEKAFANREAAYFTPTLIFYNELGDKMLQLRGYYPPYVVRAALDYMVSGSYQSETFNQYQARAHSASSRKSDAIQLHSHPLLSPPPHQLDRHTQPASRPLLVLFEQPQCHACDILHKELLNQPVIQSRLAQMDMVQLDIWSDTPVITPYGMRTTAQGWASSLNIFFTPTLFFFDEQGREIIRVDAVLREVKLGWLLRYVLEHAYLEEPNFERWFSGQLHVAGE